MIEEIIKELERYFFIERYEETYLVGQISEPKEKNINSLKELLQNAGYLPFFQKEDGKDIIRLIPGLMPKEEKTNYLLPLILLILTIFSTVLIGSLNRGGNPFVSPKDILLGLPFSFSLLTILGGHELGHYLTARRHGVSATLPHFLPIPHPLIGTMGAFIRMKSIIPSRKALLRVGIAGPVISFLLAIPITIIGLKYSKIIHPKELEGGIGLASPLIFHLLTKLFFLNIPQGKDILLHPMAFAGWLGFFVTSINLIPLGQLDGGHIAYAVFFKRVKVLNLIMIAILLFFGIRWPGWYFWIFLILVLGLRHPPTQDEITGIGSKEKILALIAFLIFLLTFTPFPFRSAH